MRDVPFTATNTPSKADSISLLLSFDCVTFSLKWWNRRKLNGFYMFLDGSFTDVVRLLQISETSGSPEKKTFKKIIKNSKLQVDDYLT